MKHGTAETAMYDFFCKYRFFDGFLILKPGTAFMLLALSLMAVSVLSIFAILMAHCYLAATCMWKLFWLRHNKTSELWPGRCWLCHGLVSSFQLASRVQRQCRVMTGIDIKSNLDRQQRARLKLRNVGGNNSCHCDTSSHTAFSQSGWVLG